MNPWWPWCYLFVCEDKENLRCNNHGSRWSLRKTNPAMDAMTWGSQLFFYWEGRGFHWFLGFPYLETPRDFGANPGPLDHPWPQVHPWVAGGPGAGLEGYPPVPSDVKNHVAHVFFVVELLVDDFHANTSTHVHIYIHVYKYIYTYTYLAANITAGPGSLHQPPRGSYRDATEAFHRRSGLVSFISHGQLAASSNVTSGGQPISIVDGQGLSPWNFVTKHRW